MKWIIMPHNCMDKATIFVSLARKFVAFSILMVCLTLKKMEDQEK